MRPLTTRRSYLSVGAEPMFIEGVKYSLAGAIYALRRRLPLYADDRSKISTKYAQSLLDLSVLSSVSTKRRLELWDIYADHFTMPVSVARFYDTVSQAVGVREDFEHWVASSERNDFLVSLLSKIKSLSEYRDMTVDELSHLQKSAVLVASGERLDGLTRATLKTVQSLQILHDYPQQISRVEATLDDSNGTPQKRHFKCLADSYTGNYSEGQFEASVKTDKIGEAIAKVLCNDPYFQKIFAKDIKPEIALLISDLTYRSVQNFIGLRAALKELDPETPLILTDSNSDFAPEAAKLGISVVSRNKIYDPSSIPLKTVKFANVAEEPASAKAEFFHEEWDAHIQTMDLRIAKSLAMTTATSKKPKVYILCNRRSHSYDGAIARIEKTLGEKYKFIAVNTGLPDGLAVNILAAARQDLFSALRSWTIRRMVNLTPTVHEMVSRAFETIEGLDSFERDGLLSRVQGVIESNFGMLVAHGRLFHAFRKIARVQPKTTQALLVPGRDPTVRIMARALQTAGLITTDVQVLYVTKMPRYKSPVADKIAVFDTYARTHYCERYGYKAEDIRLMGSINVDADVAQARSCNPDDVYPSFFQGPKAPVFTYGMQPVPVEDFEQAIEWCAKTLHALPDIRLIIKLHPAQSDDVIAFCEDIIRRKAGADAEHRWKVLLKTPFHEVLAVSDVLLTHYSNVAITAAAMGKAVGTLPVSGVRPSPSWADMKMATDITSSEALTEFVKANLGTSGVAETDYLKTDPHIKSGRSLQVLDELMTENIANSANQ